MTRVVAVKLRIEFEGKLPEDQMQEVMHAVHILIDAQNATLPPGAP